jgi:rSAM/selenodomain-associated transferase 1
VTSRVGVAILARAPIPGAAKTRLIPALGAEGAARLQRWMLQRTVAMALVADVGPVSLWCAGDPAHPDFAVCRAFGRVDLQPQPEGDLGERMLAAIASSSTPAGTLVIGTDCPALGAAQLRESARALGDHDAVVIPAEDGGYVLIGMKTPAPEAFAGVDWGSAATCASWPRPGSASPRWAGAGRKRTRCGMSTCRRTSTALFAGIIPTPSSASAVEIATSFCTGPETPCVAAWRNPGLPEKERHHAEATRRLSRELSLAERLQLKMHLAMCGGCRNFSRRWIYCAMRANATSV